MAHTCPECGQACYCDGDDTWMESEAANCEHDCGPEYYADDDDYPDDSVSLSDRYQYGDAPLTDPMGDA